MKIPFNKPFLTGREIEYMKDAVMSGKISGNGIYTAKCHDFFEKNYGFKKTLLTTSCTDALEMAAILIDVQPGDEVIVPSYTFVSTANAFVLRGGKIVFADSEELTPNIDVLKIEKLITPRTKAIVPVHYAGVACDMDPIMEIAEKYNLFVIEDAAQCIDSFYKGRPLGSIGHLGTFSFHETKNVIAGEGGMLSINDTSFIKRAEIIWEKGTNRTEFFRGEVDKYGWVDIGSSFLPSDTVAAFLYAQLESIGEIQKKRKKLWNIYYEGLKCLETSGIAKLPSLPEYGTNNGHMFYLVFNSSENMESCLKKLNEYGIKAVFHYQSLHKSPYYSEKHDGRILPNADMYTSSLLRLPLFYELSETEVAEIVDYVKAIFCKLQVD